MPARRLSLLPLLAAVLLAPATAAANDVEVLPRGVFALGISLHYKWGEEYFADKFGTATESQVEDYKDEIDAEFFPELNALQALARSQGVIGENEKLVLGSVDPYLKAYGYELPIVFGYGITERVSLAMILPMGWFTNEISFKPRPKNVALLWEGNKDTCTADPKTCHVSRSLPMVPFNPNPEPGKPNTISHKEGQFIRDDNEQKGLIDNRDVNTIFTDPAFGMMYDRVENYSSFGIGDLIMGVRWQFYRSADERLRLGTSLFSILPTGTWQDDNNLFDSSHGDGQLDIGFWGGVDWVPWEWLTLNFTAGYTEQLADRVPMRVLSLGTHADGAQFKIPIATASSVETVYRDYGGNIDTYYTFSFSFTDWLSLSTEFYWWFKLADRFYGDKPQCERYGGPDGCVDYQSLAWESERISVDWNIALGFNTIKPFLQKQFPFPAMFSVGFARPIAGKNQDVTNAVFVSLQLIGTAYLFADEPPVLPKAGFGL